MIFFGTGTRSKVRHALKHTVLLIALCIAIAAPAGALAAVLGELTYAPGEVSAIVPAGTQTTIVTTVNVVNTPVYWYTLRSFTGITGGNLPAGWISSSSGFLFLTPSRSAIIRFAVSVPNGTPSGNYSGYALPEAKYSHGTADPGKGFLINVTVPSECAAVADVVLVSPDAITLWPPNRSMESVRITGSIDLPAGCTLLEAGYGIDDEYGVYTSSGALAVNGDNTFSIMLPVEAWRNGDDMDGRHYNITFSVRDEAGVGTSGQISIVVPHDLRK